MEMKWRPPLPETAMVGDEDIATVARCAFHGETGRPSEVENTQCIRQELNECMVVSIWFFHGQPPSTLVLGQTPNKFSKSRQGRQMTSFVPDGTFNVAGP
jgi:hypothetical protein